MKNHTYIYIIYGILIGLLATGGIWLLASPPRGEPIQLLPTPTPGLVTVYVSGAVLSPGVYALPDGSRIEDAVNAAGGFATGAEQESINLATLVTDGQQIDVPGIVDTSHIILERININTATAEELDSLPSVGPTTAQAIVDYRLQYGNFATVQDIQNVPGVGPATFERIEDFITVGD